MSTGMWGMNRRGGLIRVDLRRQPSSFLDLDHSLVGPETTSHKTSRRRSSGDLQKIGIGAVYVPLRTNWRTAQDEINESIGKEKKKNPDNKIVVISLGEGTTGFEIDAVAQNERDHFVDGEGELPKDSVNRTNGPVFVNAGFDGEAVKEDIEFYGDGVDVDVSDTCDGFLCNTANYELISLQNEGRIDLGTFIHVPANATTEQKNGFANGVATAFGPGGDPDGDGLSTGYDPNPFQKRGL